MNIYKIETATGLEQLERLLNDHSESYLLHTIIKSESDYVDDDNFTLILELKGIR